MIEYFPGHDPQWVPPVSTPEDGPTEHVGLDHPPQASSSVADWFADVFAALPARV